MESFAIKKKFSVKQVVYLLKQAEVVLRHTHRLQRPQPLCNPVSSSTAVITYM